MSEGPPLAIRVGIEPARRRSTQEVITATTRAARPKEPSSIAGMGSLELMQQQAAIDPAAQRGIAV